MLGVRLSKSYPQFRFFTYEAYLCYDIQKIAQLKINCIYLLPKNTGNTAIGPEEYILIRHDHMNLFARLKYAALREFF